MYRIPLSPYSVQTYQEWLRIPDRVDDNLLLDQQVEGEYDVKQLDRAIRRLVTDYLLYNSHIESYDGQLYWVKNINIYGVDYFKKPLTNREIFTYIKKPFNLNKGPLYRIAVIKNGNDKYRLLIEFHHIVINGITAHFLLDEILNYYKDKSYQASISLDCQISKLTELFTKMLADVRMHKNAYESFWQEHLANVKEIKLDFLSSDANENKAIDVLQHINCISIEQLTRVGEIRFIFNEEVVKKLNKLKRLYGITPYLYGQNIYAILINLYTGQNRFCLNYSVTISESFHLIYGAQINTTLIPYDFNKIDNVVDVMLHAKKFIHLLKQDGIKKSNLPIEEILKLVNLDLLTLAFDQAFVRVTSREIENLKFVTNYEINVDLYNKLWFGQECYKEKICYSVLYALDFIDSRLLKAFIECYKSLFMEVLNALVNSDANSLTLQSLEAMLFSCVETKENILNARKKSNITVKSVVENNYITIFERDYSLKAQAYLDRQIIQQLGISLAQVTQKLLRTEQLVFLLESGIEQSGLEKYLIKKQSKQKVDTVYFECPRYWESNDPIQCILDVFFIKKLLEYTKKTTFIGVVPAAYLANGGHLFIKFIKIISNFFENFIDSNKGFLLVITQLSSNATIDYTKKILANILSDNEINLNLNQVRILESLVVQDNIVLYKDNCIENILKNLVAERFTDPKHLSIRFLGDNVGDYFLCLFDELYLQITKDFGIVCDKIKVYYENLISEKNFHCINDLIENFRDIVELMHQNNSLELMISIFYKLYIHTIDYLLDKIKVNSIVFDFCIQYATDKNGAYYTFLKSIKESISNIYNFILGNTESHLDGWGTTIVDNFIKNIEITISEQGIADLKKTMVFLEEFKRYLCFYEDSKRQATLAAFSPNIDEIILYIKISAKIYGTKHSFLLEHLQSNIIRIINLIIEKLKVLQQITCIEIRRLFKELCNYIIKDYKNYTVSQIAIARDVLNKLQNLIKDWQESNSVTLLEIIVGLEKKYIAFISQLNLVDIQRTIDEIRLLEERQEGIISSSDQIYVNDLLRTCNIMQLTYNNLYAMVCPD